jgi:hypothetical protein
MPQLVGSLCVRCHEKIGSIIEGEHCPACGCPVHTKCVRASSVPFDDVACQVCGAEAKDVIERQAQEQTASSGEPRTAALARQPGCFSLGCCILVILVGVGSLGTYVFILLYGVTPENQLTIVEGFPTDVKLSRYRRHQHVTFTVDGIRTEYSSERPHYEDLMRALESREPVRAWVSTKRETLFERDGWVPLYKMGHRGRLIIRYQDVVAYHEEGSMSVLIVGIAIVGLGVMGLFLYFRARRIHVQSRHSISFR